MTYNSKAEDANAFYLDYLLLQTGNAFVTELSGTSGSGSVNNGSSGGSGDGSSGSNTGDDGNSGSSGTNVGTNVGAIAGGVVGGVVALAAIGLAIFLWLRRRRDKNEYPSKGQFDMAAEDRYVSTGGDTDAHGYGQREEQGWEHGMPTGMYQRQRRQSGKQMLFILCSLLVSES